MGHTTTGRDLAVATRYGGLDPALPAASAASLRRYALASRAPSTLAKYQADWRVFAAWCAAGGRRTLPAGAETVAAYLSHLAEVASPRTR